MFQLPSATGRFHFSMEIPGSNRATREALDRDATATPALSSSPHLARARPGDRGQGANRFVSRSARGHTLGWTSRDRRLALDGKIELELVANTLQAGAVEGLDRIDSSSVFEDFS